MELNCRNDHLSKKFYAITKPVKNLGIPKMNEKDLKNQVTAGKIMNLNMLFLINNENWMQKKNILRSFWKVRKRKLICVKNMNTIANVNITKNMVIL